MSATGVSTPAAVNLSWIPLGAGQQIVKISGTAFEAISAVLQRRTPCDIYHAALVITVPEGRYTIEMTPIPDHHGETRGVVAEGPVGMKWLGRFRIFRYEIRRWSGGVIPDLNEAVSTATISTDAACAHRLLELLPTVPVLVWGRDELHAGDMWNSNSVIAWLLTRGHIDTDQIAFPIGGRAPGWSAGLVVAKRQLNEALTVR